MLSELEAQIKPLRWTRLWPEALVLAVGLGLYVFQLGQESLWIDEMLSLGSARGPLDLNRPLYFWLLRGWLRVSEDEAWLRSLSVLFGLGCIILTYWLGRRLVRRSVGLVAALIFALSPLAINHAQEVRFYMMSACLGVAGSLCLSYALRQPKASLLFGWIAFRCLGFLTAQPNLLLIVPDFILIGGLLNTASRSSSAKSRQILGRGETTQHLADVHPSWEGPGEGRPVARWADPPHPAGTPPPSTPLRASKRGSTYGERPMGLISPHDFVRTDADRQSRSGLRRWRWALLVLLIPIAIILNDVVGPLIEFLLNQKWYAGAARPPTVSNLVGLLAALTAWPLAGPDALSRFYQPLFTLYAGLILVGALFPLMVKKLRSPQLIWLALWGFLPVLLVFLLSQFFPFLWLERYAVISIPYIAILLAAGWVWLWQWRKGVAIALATFYFVALSGPLMRYYTTDYHADWRGLAEEIATEERMGDRVIIYPGSFLPYIEHYYDGKAELVPINSVDSHTDASPELLIAEIQKQMSTNGRFWLVCPIKDDWKAVKESLFEELTEKDHVLKTESPRLNHWNWGPILYLFE